MEFDFDEIFDEKESEHATKQVIKGWTPGGGNPLWDADGVVDGVFVGSRKSAMDKDEMLRRNIGFVLICSAEFECRPRFQHLFTYKMIPIIDSHGEIVTDYFEEASSFISGAISTKKNVLVHCWSGVSRSATMVLAFCLIHLRLGLNQSLKLVRRSRPQIEPNPGFMKQLKALEFQLFSDEES